MDEPSDVSDDEGDEDYDTFDDTFVIVDNSNSDSEDDDDDTEGAATEVISLVDILSSSPSRPRRKREEVIGLVEALGSSPPSSSKLAPQKTRARAKTGTGTTTPRSSPFGFISPVGPMGPMGPPLPLMREPSWASQGSQTTPSLARKSSLMSFRSLRRKVSGLSVGGAGAGGGKGQRGVDEEAEV